MRSRPCSCCSSHPSGKNSADEKEKTFLSVLQLTHMLRYIPRLMENGKPVGILFTEEKGDESALLYCELIQKARFGESFLIKNQGCTVGAFVLGETEISPENYYFDRRDIQTELQRSVQLMHLRGL